MKKISEILKYFGIGIGVIFFGLMLGIFINGDAGWFKEKQKKEQEREVVETETINEYSCENEIVELEKPLDVEWYAEFMECLDGCERASFKSMNNIPSRYSYFAGYLKNGEKLEKYRSLSGVELRIIGRVWNIDFDCSKTAFKNRYMPVVDIESIEVVGDENSDENIFVEKNDNAASGIPRFKDYHVKSIFTGKPALPKFNSNPQALRYKTMISRGSAEGPNFAGEYTVVSYGCGTSCQLHTILNAKTGNIVSYNEILSEGGISYRMDSKLIIVNPPESILSYGNDLPIWLSDNGTRYFVLSEDGSEINEINND